MPAADAFASGEGTKAAKAVLSATATGVTKVLGYSKLKSNFKPHEAKRRLCASYDLFLADDRLLHLLPPLLGKSFFKKKKQPIPVDISGVSGASWAGAISRALSSTYLFLGGGACSAVRVARTQQGESEVVANVLSAAAGVAGCAGVKGGWGNVRAVYLKTNGSVALPLYTDLPLMAGAVEKEKKEAAAAAGAAPGTGKGKAAKSAPKAAKGAAEAVQAPPVAQPQPAAAGSKRKGGRALEAPPPGAAAAAAPAPAPARNKKPATAAPARKAAPAPAPAAAPAPAKRARRA